MPRVKSSSPEEAEKSTGSTEQPAEGFFTQVWGLFEEAAQAAGSKITHRYQIGSQNFRLQFAGPELVPVFTRALAHRAITREEEDFTIRIWDSCSTQTTMPPPPWPPSAYGAKGQIQGYNTERFRTLYQPGIDILYLADLVHRRGLIWVSAAQEVPRWIMGFPLRVHLHWSAIDTPFQMLHAAGIGDERGAVMLAGVGGSGKSTAALACLRAGMEYLGDDYLMAEVNDDPRLYSLYCSAKLHTTALEKFPELSTSYLDSPERIAEKSLFFLYPEYARQLAASRPLRAILLPRVDAYRHTSIKPIPSSRIFQSLAPSSLFQLPGDEEQSFQRIRTLVSCVPTYILHSGSDYQGIAEAIRELLESYRL